MERIFKYKVTIALVTGFVIGALWLTAIRFLVTSNNNVHYHANFALYVNGEPDEFESFTFYEEVQTCTADSIDDPSTRVHMHNQENSVVHVHDNGVTWGNFFENLGYGLSDAALTTDDAVYVDGQGGQLSFILNGKAEERIANTHIHSEDVLLINFGNESAEELVRRADSIPADAHAYNAKDDPGGCSGNSPLTFTERLKRAFGI